MNHMTRTGFNFVLIVTALLAYSTGFVFAEDTVPMTPERAAKMETVRKQHEQRITKDQRKTAAEALKTERMKVHNAKRAAQHTQPTKIENK